MCVKVAGSYLACAGNHPKAFLKVIFITEAAACGFNFYTTDISTVMSNVVERA